MLVLRSTEVQDQCPLPATLRLSAQMIDDLLTITIRKPAVFRRNMGHSEVESRRFRAESRFAALWTKFEKGACIRLPRRAPPRAKTPGIVRFSWASATCSRSGYPHQQLSL